MSIELRCPACQRMLRVPDTARGKRIKCPKCGQTFQASNDDPASARAPAAEVKQPAKKPAAGPAPLRPPVPQPDPLDSKAVIPGGETRVDRGPPRKVSVKKDPVREDPNLTSDHTPVPEDPNQTQALDGECPAKPDPTRVDKPRRDSRVNEGHADTTDSIPDTLGGYQVLKELGKGGMGMVFLARQKSLDRHVALKIMNPKRASDPSFLARFTREAYAAAQLVNHHIVQIYDIGTDQGLHFYSMEYVKGESLMDLIQREGKLDPEVAVGYILQAARGLKFGHDLGMVHRDIKPDNLLINEQGIVKVADLGLVNPYQDEPDHGPESEEEDQHESQVSRGLSQVTRVGVAVGTPSYMAPEQARDATSVDARADIYSLGCTLYVLVTGKPPFEGKTIVEVLSKHATAAIVPPDVIVKRVPKALSAILAKMLAKKPADRFQDLGAVITALEKYLGIQLTGTFTPREEHATVLEQCVKKFNESTRARLRTTILWGFAGGCATLILLCLLFKWIWPAGGILGLGCLTAASYFLVHGWKEKTYLFLKVRSWFLDTTWTERLYGGAAVLFLLLLLYLFHLLWLWLPLSILALGLAVALHVLVDRQLAIQRQAPIEKAEKLLRTMRLQGLEEKALRHFICKYSGKNWEEFFEALFGYEAKLMAREWLRGEAAQRRNKFAAWRDPLVHWIDANGKARKEARERKLLQTIEAKALEAQGVDAKEAREKAAQVAEVMVAQAAVIQQEAAQPVSPQAESAPKTSLRQLLETAQNPEATAEFVLPRKRSLPIGQLLAGLVGARCRFLAGALLFTLCMLWMYQNELLEGDRFFREFGTIIAEGDLQKLRHVTQPLELPLLPGVVGNVFNSFFPGIAGLILMLSAFVGGWKTSLVAWPAAGLILLGSLLPPLGPLSGGLVGLLAGLGLAMVGMAGRWFMRKKTVPPAGGSAADMPEDREADAPPQPGKRDLRN